MLRILNVFVTSFHIALKNFPGDWTNRLTVVYSLKSMWNTPSVCLCRSAESATEAISLAPHSVSHTLKVMCHTDVVAPIVTNRFPYFRRTSSFFDSKAKRVIVVLRFSYFRRTSSFFDSKAKRVIVVLISGYKNPLWFVFRLKAKRIIVVLITGYKNPLWFVFRVKAKRVIVVLIRGYNNPLWFVFRLKAKRVIVVLISGYNNLLCFESKNELVRRK